METLLGDRVKIVEKAGTMVKRILTKSDPWAGGQCGRQHCLICSTEEGGGDCRRRNVTYKTQCLLCKEKGEKEKVYIGETSRTAYERGSEHKADYENEKEDSHMRKHWEEEHYEEDKPKFSMKVLRGHTSALVRQVHEAVMIELNAQNVLNSKAEYNRCQLPRLGVKMGEKCQEEKETKEMTETEIFTSISSKPNAKRSQKTEIHEEPPGKKRKFMNKKEEGRRRIVSAIKPSNKRKIEEDNIKTTKKMKTTFLEANENTASITAKENETENSLNKLKEKKKFTFKNPSKFDQKNQQTNVRKITEFFENAFDNHVSKSGKFTTQAKNSAQLVKNENKATPTSSLITTTHTTHGKLRTQKSMYRKLPPSYKFKKLTDHFSREKATIEKAEIINPNSKPMISDEKRTPTTTKTYKYQASLQ